MPLTYFIDDLVDFTVDEVNEDILYLKEGGMVKGLLSGLEVDTDLLGASVLVFYHGLDNEGMIVLGANRLDGTTISSYFLGIHGGHFVDYEVEGTVIDFDVSNDGYFAFLDTDQGYKQHDVLLGRSVLNFRSATINGYQFLPNSDRFPWSEGLERVVEDPFRRCEVYQQKSLPLPQSVVDKLPLTKSYL